MRRLILCRLSVHLKEYYDIEWTGDPLADGTTLMHEVEAVLAFKSDAVLDELRCALERLEDGTFGACLCCKQAIDRRLLDADPTRRVCSECEREFAHVLSE
jgi:RNA polymerase-binding transcription factor DksA